jgi:hypothetical protein
LLRAKELERTSTMTETLIPGPAQPYAVLKADAPQATALAALATVCRHHGLPLSVPLLRKLTGLPSAAIDGVMLMYGAGRCGFDALPFEVEFSQLPLVALPAVLMFRDETFHVLHAVDETSATVGDTLTGEVRQFKAQELEALWAGDVYQISPNDSLKEARGTLHRLQSPYFRVAAVVGALPLSLPRLLFSTALLLWIAGLFVARPVTLLTGFCVLTSLWMLAYPRGCQKCGTTKSLAGNLPLPALGGAFYALLTIATVAAPPAMLAAGLLAATGAHIGLVLILLRKRIACYPCLATAGAAWTATALTIRHIGWETWALPASLIGTVAALYVATRLARSESTMAALLLAQRVTAELPLPAPQTAKLVVYSRAHCPICAYAKGIILPALAEEFGESLAIEVRDAEHLKMAVPAFFVTGAARLALVSVGTDEMLPRLAAAVQVALTPAQSPLGELGGLTLSGFDETFSASAK